MVSPNSSFLKFMGFIVEIGDMLEKKVPRSRIRRRAITLYLLNPNLVHHFILSLYYLTQTKPRTHLWYCCTGQTVQLYTGLQQLPTHQNWCPTSGDSQCC